MKPIVILSIDGGGLRGVVPLTILAEVQRRIYPQRQLWQCFDLVAGTSTGGLITSALTLRDEKMLTKKAKYSIEQIMKVYREEGHIIFPEYRGLAKLWHKGQDAFRPRFDDKGIHEVFSRVVGESKVSDCLTNILVSTYDLNNNRPLFFKSIDRKHDKRLDARLYDICRATSAGPTYLPTYKFYYPKNENAKKPEDRERPHRNCVDGGIYVNNPSMAALAEVVKNFEDYMPDVKKKEDIDFKQIFVLSVGTGTYSAEFTDEESSNKGLLWWAQNISELMMRGVNKTTDYEMNEMMEDGNYLRLTINIDNAEHAEMSDSGKATTDYLVESARQQVILNQEKMDKLSKWLVKAGLAPASPATPLDEMPKAGEYTLGTMRDIVTRTAKPKE